MPKRALKSLPILGTNSKRKLADMVIFSKWDAAVPTMDFNHFCNNLYPKNAIDSVKIVALVLFQEWT